MSSLHWYIYAMEMDDKSADYNKGMLSIVLPHRYYQ